MITIIDYGLGNIGSLSNMLKKIGVESNVSSSIDDIEKADKLILPGIGSFDEGMQNIEKLIPVLEKKVLEDKTPILGICLGMQLFAKKSEEGKLNGLGWIDADVIRFDNELKIPHMGWNLINPVKESCILKDMLSDSRFYFVHSYHIRCNKDDVLTTTNYGYDFTSAFSKENIIGVQFHPEKSHKYGMKLLSNFANLC